jgi:hypothetical protein
MKPTGPRTQQHQHTILAPKIRQKAEGAPLPFFCRTAVISTGIAARAAIAPGVGFCRFISTWIL